MNCEKCLALLSGFLDGELSFADCAALETHLSECLSCAMAQNDFLAIRVCCEETRSHIDAPPNAQALWLRISNIIESEQSALVKETAKKPLVEKASWNKRLFQTMDKSWKLSLQQVVSAVLGIMIITSLITIVSVQNASRVSATTASSFQQFFGNYGATNDDGKDHRFGLENRLRQQQLAIDYWNQRVDSRKRGWNPNIRDAFDRNLHEIDLVVTDYKQQLQTNPNDQISEEMLDTALNDKMELLRDFSDL